MVPAALALSSLLALSPTGPSFLVAQPEADPSASEADPAEAIEPPDEDPAASLSDDEDPAEVAAEAEAPAAEPAAEVAAAPLTVPEKKGLGLMITAGALGAMGWGVMAGRMAIVKNGCKNDTDLTTVEASDIDELLVSGGSCLGARAKTVGLWFLQAIPNSANWGLAPGAGALRGTYDAARFVLEDGPDRKPFVFVGVGAGLLGVSAIGRTVVAAIRWRAFRNLNESYVLSCFADDGSTTPEQFFDCYARKNMLQFFGQQVTSAGISAGAGLLTYGLAYKKTRDKYQKAQGTGKVVEEARVELSITPQLSLYHTGISASLRF